MRIKTYFVKTVDEALAQAHLELGPDALLLNTRRLMQAGKPNGYEVVLGVKDAPVQAEPSVEHVFEPVAEPVAAPRAEKAPQVAIPAPPPLPVPAAPIAPQHLEPLAQQPAPAPDHLTEELKRLHAQMDEIQQLLLRSNRAQAVGGRVIPELGELYSRLLEEQVDTLLAKDIVDRLEATISTDAFFLEASRSAASDKSSSRWKVLRPAADVLEKFLRAELERRIRIVPTIGVHSGTLSPVTVLVGPTGSGKTTTIAKLAVAASAQAPVRLLSLDWSRPAASQQLQALAVGPNIAFTAINSLENLPQIFAEARRGHCVLVDTAGYALADWNSAEDLAAALAKCPEVDVHLAVPAYMNPADFRRVMERYQIFKPSKLVVTKMDEAQAFGPAFSEAVRAGLALSFVTDGPRVPDDIQSASLDELVALSHDQPQRGSQRAA